MQFPTVLTLRRFTNFSRARTWSFHSDRKADKLSSLNDDAVLRTGDLLMRNRREDRTMALREKSISNLLEGDTLQQKVHSASCHVPRSDTHETKGCYLGWPPDAEATVEGKKKKLGVSRVTYRKKKKKERIRKLQRFAHLECRSERRIMPGHIIYLFPSDSYFP